MDSRKTWTECVHKAESILMILCGEGDGVSGSEGKAEREEVVVGGRTAMMGRE